MAPGINSAMRNLRKRESVRTAARDASDLTDYLMSEINSFMGDAPRSDDITMMTLKRIQS